VPRFTRFNLVSGEYRFTDVWIKQDNRWLAVASQATRIAES